MAHVKRECKTRSEEPLRIPLNLPPLVPPQAVGKASKSPLYTSTDSDEGLVLESRISKIAIASFIVDLRIIVDFRINETLQTGGVGKRTYRSTVW